MDFPSIVSSTADLTLYPHVMHDGGDFDVSRSPRPEAVSSSPSDRNRRSSRSLMPIAIVTAFFLPLTVFPYALARRQITVLRRQLAQTQTSVKILEQELNLSWQEITAGKDDVQKLRGSFWKMLQDREQQKALVERKEREGSKFESEVKTELQILLREAQNTRSQAVILCSLGTSLADVAAFMHEVELEMGMLSPRGQDQRGIDRLRSLALQMQNADGGHSKLKPGAETPTHTTEEFVDEVNPY